MMIAMDVTLRFDYDESAYEFIENVNREGEVLTCDEDTLGGVSNDFNCHKVKVVSDAQDTR